LFRIQPKTIEVSIIIIIIIIIIITVTISHDGYAWNSSA
jgi:hypothetical protein